MYLFIISYFPPHPPVPVCSGPCSSSRARSVSMHSWTMYRALSWAGSLGRGRPYGARTSWTLTTFSWSSRRVILTSRRPCFTVTASRITSFLIATRCPVRWSRAERTRPVTPTPRGRRSTKWPPRSKPWRKRGASCLAMMARWTDSKYLKIRLKVLYYSLLRLMLHLAGESGVWTKDLNLLLVAGACWMSVR